MDATFGQFQLNNLIKTDAAAITQMPADALWAGVVLCNTPIALGASFHTFSLAVWTIKLLSFVFGMLMVYIQ